MHASECLHRTLALEHESREPLKLEEEVHDPEGGFKDLVHVENNFHNDAHLRVFRRLLTNPVVKDEWKRTIIFYTIVRCRKTYMKMVIDDGSTINVVAKSSIKRCHLKIDPHPHPFKVARSTRPT